MSQCLIQALLNAKGTTALMKIRSMKLQLQAFLAYSERHFQRIDKLHQASHVLEYMTNLMSVLPESTENEQVSLLSGKKVWEAEDDVPLNIFDNGNRSGSVSNNVYTPGDDSDDSDSDNESQGKGTHMNRAAEASFSGIIEDSSSDEEKKVKSAEKVNKKRETPKSTGKRKEKPDSTPNTPSSDKKRVAQAKTVKVQERRERSRK